MYFDSFDDSSLFTEDRMAAQYVHMAKIQVRRLHEFKKSNNFLLMKVY